MHADVVLTVASSWYLVGLSVTVGLVVYPSFDLVEGPRFGAFHRHHVARITWAVAPAWAAQALGLVLWFVRAPGVAPASWWWSADGALSALVVTATSAVPRHRRLEHGFDPRVTRNLRGAHWVRTVAWVLSAIAATTALATA